MSKDEEKKIHVFQIETKDFNLSEENLMDLQQVIQKAINSPEFKIYLPDKIDLSIIRKSLGELKRINVDEKMKEKYKNYIQLLDNVKVIRVKEFRLSLDPSIEEEPDYENLLSIAKTRFKDISKDLGIKVEIIGDKEPYEIKIEQAKTSNSMDAKSIYNIAYTLLLVSGVMHHKTVSLKGEFEGIVIPKDMETINSWLESEGLQGCAKDPGQLRSILKMIAIKKFFMNHMYGGE